MYKFFSEKFIHNSDITIKFHKLLRIKLNNFRVWYNLILLIFNEFFQFLLKKMPIPYIIKYSAISKI